MRCQNRDNPRSLKMKFTIENVGPIKETTVEMGKLTIVCGLNNTGKTYLTRTIYDFYKLFRRNLGFSIKIESRQFPIDIDLRNCTATAVRAVKKCAANFSKSVLKTGVLKIHIASQEFPVDCEAYESTWIFNDHVKLHVKKKGTILHINQLIIDQQTNPVTEEKSKADKKILKDDFQKIISAIVQHYLFHQSCNDGYIADIFAVMSERNGLVRFKSHINIANALVAGNAARKEGSFALKRISEGEEKDYEQKLLPLSRSMIHALTIFEREKTFVDRKQSDFQKQFNEDLDKLVEGKYGIEKGEFYYVPHDAKDKQLTMEQCSSSVESLLLLDFYVRYFSEKGDILVIDEPELNLHPVKQRHLARFLGTLVNAGIKVFITTHSDYIIREFNTMIQLNQDKPQIKKIQNEENYPDSQLLNAVDIRAYVAKKEGDGVTFESALVSQADGIVISSLDDVIDKMNQIQDAIVWGAE